MHPVHQQLADSLSAGLFFVIEELLCLNPLFRTTRRSTVQPSSGNEPQCHDR